MDKFKVFARLVESSVQGVLKSRDVFVADVDGDVLYQKYLAAFPEGTDPFFRKTTEHDCSTCRHFLRRAGAIVTIDATVWDEAAEDAPDFYKTVARAMRDAVRSAGIRDIFRVGTNERRFGAEETRSLDAATQDVTTWNHFCTGEIPARFRSATPDAERGNFRTTAQVFERGLVELSPDAVDTVMSLIESNALYRGEEHKPAAREFQKMQRDFLASSDRSSFVWANAASPAARFRNTVIGTLVQDLSEGQGLERAVQSFETKVAPQNYKRTTALIAPGMIKKAMETIEELGLEPALERRFAVIGDVSVNDVKWVDGSVKSLMKGGIGDVLMKHATNGVASKDEDRAEDVGLEEFMTRVLPEATGLEVLFRGSHAGNLVSLTAPVHPEPKQLFRWSNDFAWSYGGNVADSIKERVKKAGGEVQGTLRVSLSWFNHDDLDIHVYEPSGRGLRSLHDHIFFRNKHGWTGGTLDVDMNAGGGGTTREPVENVIWPAEVPDGPYKIVVNNYAYRESRDPGFTVEVENAGKVLHFSWAKGVRDRQDIHVCTLRMKGGVIDRVDAGEPGVTSSAISQEKWGLQTEKYVKVSAVMLSPNYWGSSATGNRHTFLILEGAKNDEDTRGFYSEFLHPRLEPHRKVFEVIADKTKCRPTEGQLSGLGFSSTKKDAFLVRAHMGKKTRIYNVRVGT